MFSRASNGRSRSRQSPEVGGKQTTNRHKPSQVPSAAEQEESIENGKRRS